jgi:hypothetical protein
MKKIILMMLIFVTLQNVPAFIWTNKKIILQEKYEHKNQCDIITLQTEALKVLNVIIILNILE